MNHDEHYRKIETQGVEPIVAMESVACLGLPQELTATIKRNLNLALAIKHITRCGEKEGQHANTEIAKAQNYLTRAMTGGWRPVAKAKPSKATTYFAKMRFKDEVSRLTWGDLDAIRMSKDSVEVRWPSGRTEWIPKEELEFMGEQ